MAAAGTVGRHTKQGLLENQPAVEAVVPGSTGRSPTVNIDIGLWKTHPFTCWKRLILLTFCRYTESYTGLVIGL